MRQRSTTARKQGEVSSWTRNVFRKLLNFSSKEFDFSAGDEDWKNNSDFEDDDDDEEEEEEDLVGVPCMIRRRNSETLRAQYIDAKDVRVCVGTWNVGGKVPHDDLDIEEWLDTNDPADIYVLGIQEIIPLSAGNIFVATDTSPVPIWENLIRQSLNKVRMKKQRYKCHSVPSSPSRFKPSADTPTIIEELLLPETDSDGDDERIHPFDELQNESDDLKHDEVSSCSPMFDANSPSAEKSPSTKRLNRCRGFSLIDEEAIAESPQHNNLTKTLSNSERIGLAWPEQPLDLLAKCASDSPRNFRSKSLKTCCSFKSTVEDCKDSLEFRLIPKLDHGPSFLQKKRSSYVRLISKQMVGIFISIWVRRSLRKHIQNLKVSDVGVGAMGYIGNKGAVSVSMSIYQTQFCFICAHLSSGEKNGDELRRNTDVQEIHRRTRFMGLAKLIQDHERIFWFGDLNYRINLSYERAHELISAKKWYALAEKDQLKGELKKGRAFDGWAEGIINFPPTYKYELNSEKYTGQDCKAGRRTPAWCLVYMQSHQKKNVNEFKLHELFVRVCGSYLLHAHRRGGRCRSGRQCPPWCDMRCDRILTFGKGMKLLSYRRSELKLSDHRPVTATILAEVEVFSPRKLQRALTLTDAEVDDGKIIADIDVAVGLGRLMLGEGISKWER